MVSKLISLPLNKVLNDKYHRQIPYVRRLVQVHVNVDEKLSKIGEQQMELQSCIDELIRDISFQYSSHFPELLGIVWEDRLIVECAAIIKDRKGIDRHSLGQLENTVQDKELAEQILDAARSSEGVDISPEVLAAIKSGKKRIAALRKKQMLLQEREYFLLEPDSTTPQFHLNMYTRRPELELLIPGSSLTSKCWLLFYPSILPPGSCLSVFKTGKCSVLQQPVHKIMNRHHHGRPGVDSCGHLHCFRVELFIGLVSFNQAGLARSCAHGQNYLVDILVLLYFT